MDEDTVVFYGGSVKALGDGRVGGHLVRFTNEDEPDLEGEFFSKDTDFGEHVSSPVYYAHGMDTKLGPRVLSTGEMKIDDVGVWIEAQLELRDEYEQFIYRMAEAQKIGWSSGTASHLVERVPGAEGKATWIKRWPLGLDASLTLTPAEPKNVAMPLKSWEPTAIFPETEAEAVETAPAVVKSGDGDGMDVGKIRDINVGGNEMDEQVVGVLNEIKDLLRQPEPAPAPETKDAPNPFDEKLNEILELIKTAPAAKDAGYIAPDSETDHSEVKSFGDFLYAIRVGNHKRLRGVYHSVRTNLDDDFDATKTAMAEDAGATGGYLVPTEFENRLLEAARESSVVRASGATVIPGNARQVEVPALDVETAPDAGESAFLGGVSMAWTEEAAAITETEPSFRQVTLTAHKLAGYSLASNEVRADSAQSLDSILSRLFGDAIAWFEDYAFLRGTGVGQPLGILNSGALISDARSAASAFALADGADMMSRFLPQSWNKGAWYLAPDLLTKLIQQVSAPLSWLTDLRSGLPMTYLGKPVYVTEKLPALNTAGDVLLVDPSYYLIYDRAGVSIAYSEHYKFVNDQGTWRVTKRVDGQPWINAAITLQDGTRTVSPFVALAAG